MKLLTRSSSAAEKLPEAHCCTNSDTAGGTHCCRLPDCSPTPVWLLPVNRGLLLPLLTPARPLLLFLLPLLRLVRLLLRWLLLLLSLLVLALQ